MGLVCPEVEAFLTFLTSEQLSESGKVPLSFMITQELESWSPLGPLHEPMQDAKLKWMFLKTVFSGNEWGKSNVDMPLNERVLLMGIT